MNSLFKKKKKRKDNLGHTNIYFPLLQNKCTNIYPQLLSPTYPGAFSGKIPGLPIISAMTIYAYCYKQHVHHAYLNIRLVTKERKSNHSLRKNRTVQESEWMYTIGSVSYFVHWGSKNWCVCKFTKVNITVTMTITHSQTMLNILRNQMKVSHVVKYQKHFVRGHFSKSTSLEVYQAL